EVLAQLVLVALQLVVAEGVAVFRAHLVVGDEAQLWRVHAGFTSTSAARTAMSSTRGSVRTGAHAYTPGSGEMGSTAPTRTRAVNARTACHWARRSALGRGVVVMAGPPDWGPMGHLSP